VLRDGGRGSEGREKSRSTLSVGVLESGGVQCCSVVLLQCCSVAVCAEEGLRATRLNVHPPPSHFGDAVCGVAFGVAFGVALRCWR